MKKIFSIMAVAALTLGFTACEDIPSPYEIFDEIVNGDAEDIYYESAACYTGWNLELGKDQTITYNPWSQGSSYTQATGYQKWDGSDSKSNKEAEGYLVSPKFNTRAKDNNVVFSFDYCIGYAQNDKDFAKHTKLYVSKTYTEGAIDLAEWEQINWVPTHTSTDWTLANTGNIALPEEYQNQDNVHVAFYFYAPAGGSATFEIMNFVIETGEAGAQPDVPGVGGSENVLPYESASCNEGWTSAKGAAEDPWSQGSSYTQATGYQKWDGSSKSNKEVDGYLFSPAINTTAASGEVKIAFDYCVGYAQNDADFAKHIKVYATNTATGNTFKADEWKQLDWTATHTSSDWTLKTTEIQLPAEFVNQENVRVAFWFYAPADKSSTFELKNFKMLEGKAAVEEGGNNESSSDNALPYSSASLYQGWTTLAGAAKNPWSQGNSYTQATGYQKWDGADSKSNAEVDGYLISPSINTKAKGTDVKMSFEYCVAYANNDADFAKHIKVYVSNKADGSSFKADEWKQLDWTATHTSTDWTLATEEIQLPAEFVNQENVHVAFWFYAPADKSSTFELKNFKMLEGKVGESAPSDNPPVVSGSSENGDFEQWSDASTPAHWKTTSTAGNAKLTQSTDAHGGKYSVEVEGVSGTNKRIGREEMTLEAGDYTMTFWVKAATSTGASIRPGYVPVTDGKVGGYSYGEYTNDIPSDKWIQVTHNFTISNTGVYSLVIMNAGKPGGSVLVDDFVLTKGDTKIISSRKRSSQVTKRVVRK